jgi:hypothetical protein
MGGCGLDSSGSGWGPVVSCCVYGTASLSFIKWWKYFDQLRSCQILEKDCSKKVVRLNSSWIKWWLLKFNKCVVNKVLIIRPNTTIQIWYISLLLYTATSFGCPD